MGIDIEAGGRVKTKKRITTTGNPYIRLLCKLYKFLSRRTDSKFNKVIFKRLNMTKKNKPPLSISKLAKLMEGKDGKVAVLVGTITDDKRLYEVPKLTVCALRYTETARARILKAGGEQVVAGKRILVEPFHPEPLQESPSCKTDEPPQEPLTIGDQLRLLQRLLPSLLRKLERRSLKTRRPIENASSLRSKIA